MKTPLMDDTHTVAHLTWNREFWDCADEVFLCEYRSVVILI